VSRPKNYDPKYVAWVAAQGCMISGRPATIHHVRVCGGRRDDHRILPLAPEYHLLQHGPRSSIEALGKRGFEVRYGVNIEERVADYRARYLAQDGHRRT
jgi:hypothetical protein